MFIYFNILEKGVCQQVLNYWPKGVCLFHPLHPLYPAKDPHFEGLSLS